jgi:hypothetical protein
MDLMDALEAVLPRTDPAAEAREIVGVMARISRAATAALFVESEGSLQWAAGDRLPERTAKMIRRAWTSQRERLGSGIAFSESAGRPGPVATVLMWIRRPGDAGLDALYFAGVDLRPPSACGGALSRLGALLARARDGGHPAGDFFT